MVSRLPPRLPVHELDDGVDRLTLERAVDLTVDGGNDYLGVGLFVLAAAIPLNVAGSLFLPLRSKPYGAPIWRKSTGFDA